MRIVKRKKVEKKPVKYGPHWPAYYYRPPFWIDDIPRHSGYISAQNVDRDIFVCPDCGQTAKTLVCKYVRDPFTGEHAIETRIDGCGNCVDAYGVYFRLPVQEALSRCIRHPRFPEE